jgi:hypothetical protein
MDYKNKKFYTVFDRTESDKKKKVETYGQDALQRVKSDNGEWKNVTLNSDQLSKTYGFSLLKESDILCCALGVDFPDTGTEFVLEGTADLFDYSNTPITLEGFKDYKLNDINSKIIVDKKTKLVKEIIFNATLPQKHKISNAVIDFVITLKTKFYDHNGEFTVFEPTT